MNEYDNEREFYENTMKWLFRFVIVVVVVVVAIASSACASKTPIPEKDTCPSSQKTVFPTLIAERQK